MKMTDERIEEYCLQKSTVPSELCIEMGNHTRENHPLGRMISGEMVSSLLGFLARANGANKVLEIGTFTGYSALAIAENIPQDGVVITIDKNKKINDYAQSNWDKSPHGNKIQALFGDANKVIAEMNDKFDFVFIDADKGSYKNYLDLSLERLNEGGVIVVDNVLWSGKVVDGFSQEESDETTQRIIEFNEYVSNKEDIYKTLVPIRDGLFLIQKK